MTIGNEIALLQNIATKKARLDALRPLKRDALVGLRKHFDVELTYTSNAIEGKTLSLRETAEVIEHGLTIGGKPLRYHLEAQDHYDAIGWVRSIADGSECVSEGLICDLHRRIVLRSNPDIAGIYSRHPRRIAGSAAVFAAASKIPDMMAELGKWLESAPPFARDGNTGASASGGGPSFFRRERTDSQTLDEFDFAERRLPPGGE